MKKISLILIIIIFSLKAFSQNKYNIRTVAFYNLENLFDTIDDPHKYDEASPIMEMKGNKEKVYRQKVKNMAKVMSLIGKKEAKQSPAIIGLAEIENRKVLKDLLNTTYLKNKDYGFIHYNSPDMRGIDVALVYNKSVFKPTHHKSYFLKIKKEDGKLEFTRDQLLVSGYLDGDYIHFIVNHWPSRRGGQRKSRFKREKAAKLTLKIIEDIKKQDPNPKVIIMGDLNDDPTNYSIKRVLKAKRRKSRVQEGGLFNPMENMFKKGLNTLGYRNKINLFDQMIISEPLLVSKKKGYDSYRFFKARIYNPKYLTLQRGRYKGYPFRSWRGNRFTNGYSDHYPVYVYLVKRLEDKVKDKM
ncbi:MAG: endonuclease/exonuclease/phosphatase family protein [Flavobacteriaceae bacterium]|nr:endonuclease/exonuclease/phosphatase family protein [Flavobacteriaceae bacterium]